MGVFKEEAHTFETIAKNSKRIFNDAADLGYPYVDNKPDNNVKQLIESINGLKKLDKKFPDEKLFIRNRQSWGTRGTYTRGVSLDVIIFWEQNNGNDCGTKYHISFNKLNPKHPSNLHKGNDSFISVDIERHIEPT